jgi:uncharacterized membrane protein
MREQTLQSRLRENATEIVSMLVTGIWLAALFTDQSWWLAAMLFGYIVVIPIVSILAGDEEDEETAEESTTESTPTPTSETKDDALATLRNRYARGELTEEQFERKVERLLETETLEDVEDRAVSADVGDSSGRAETRENADARNDSDDSAREMER